MHRPIQHRSSELIWMCGDNMWCRNIMIIYDIMWTCFLLSVSYSSHLPDNHELWTELYHSFFNRSVLMLIELGVFGSMFSANLPRACLFCPCKRFDVVLLTLLRCARIFFNSRSAVVGQGGRGDSPPPFGGRVRTSIYRLWKYFSTYPSIYRLWIFLGK